MSKKIILGIAGSHHGKDPDSVVEKYKKSASLELLKRALKAAEKRGFKTELIILDRDDFVQKVFSNKKDKTVRYYQKKLKKTSGVIFATPTHWFDMSIQIKAFIDFVFWDFAFEPFEMCGKPLGLIATCNDDGANQAMMNIASSLNHCGMFVPPFGMLFHNLAMPTHGLDGWQNDAESIGNVVADYIE
jgi:multimeric flavodoxin WrbA